MWKIASKLRATNYSYLSTVMTGFYADIHKNLKLIFIHILQKTTHRHDLFIVMTGFYADIYNNLKLITDFYLHFTENLNYSFEQYL